MADAIDAMIDEVIRREGGFVDDPADRGGATKYGITRRTLSAWLGRTATVDEVRSLDRPTAAAIYRALFFERPRLGILPQALQPLIFDMAVNHGPERAVELLQEVLAASRPVAVDGDLGPQTAGAAAIAWDALGPWLIAMLANRRERFYRAIVANDRTQERFLKGWLRKRVEPFRPSDAELQAWGRRRAA